MKDKRVWVAGSSFENKEEAGKVMTYGFSAVLIFFGVSALIFEQYAWGIGSLLIAGGMIWLYKTK